MTQCKGEKQIKRPPVKRFIHRQSDGTPEKRPGHTTKTHERDKQNVDHENIILNGSHHTTSTPLANKETTTMRRTEATEEQSKIKPNTRLETLHNIYSRGALTPKTKVITSNPSIKLLDTKQVTKNLGNHRQLIRGETK